MTEDFYGKGSIPLSMQGLEELVGLELISSDARAIGTVEGVSIDVSEWYVRAIRVGLRRGTEKLIGRQTRFFMLDKVLINTVNLGRVSDAVMMLDLRNTNALFFKNAGTGRHNMVYRRDDGSIGWVEPA